VSDESIRGICLRENVWVVWQNPVVATLLDDQGEGLVQLRVEQNKVVP
jgi:hypothetical protein